MYFFKAILLLISYSIANMIATFLIKKKIFNYAELTQLNNNFITYFVILSLADFVA